MSADKDRGIRRQKQKRAKERKRELKLAYQASGAPTAPAKPSKTQAS